ncbi:MAG TPA: SMP-30/gluconolactonase/LRE family protein, partial [Candidatus Limnocylindrales bacterium]
RPNGVEKWRVGTHGSGKGRFLNPRDVAVDSRGRIFVADTRNSRIVRLARNGDWQRVFKGPADDRISWPMGLTITDDVLYVADAGKKKARAFDLNGNLLRTWTSNGDCQIADLRDVDADRRGYVYVANYKQSNIAVLRPDGSCARTFGTNGTADDQFKTPYGVRIARDPVQRRELVYVADGNNDAVKVWTKFGEFVGAFGGPGEPPTTGTFAELRRVAVASDGDVWAADLWGWRIERFDRTASGWSYAQTIGAPLPTPTAGAVFHETQQVAVAADGTAWIVDRVHHRIVHMNPSTGALLGTCGGRGAAIGRYNWPQGIAVDPVTGNLWVANTKQYDLHVVGPDCTPVAKFGGFGAELGQLNWPYALVIRGSDRLAFVVDTKNDRIVTYDVATRTAIASFGTQGAGSGRFQDPGGIGLDPVTGHLYVADTLNDRVVEIQTDDGIGFTWIRAIGGFDRPGGVAVDASGRIAVADTGRDRVVLLAPDGSTLGVITDPTMDMPESVAFAPNGRLSVSDTYQDRVLVYAPLGA